MSVKFRLRMAVENREGKEEAMQYTSRGMRRRRNTDKWEITLSHKDPITGEQVRSFHTIEAKTEKQAERKRDELILELERKGAAAGSKMTVREFMSMFLDYKEKAAIVEASTIRGYRHESKLVCRYIGELRLGDVGIPDVNGFMASMTADGYAPKSVQGAFRLLKQAFKWAQAQDILTKNPCDYCKPPKRVKTPINALNRADRSRMLQLARNAQPQPLALAIELALTTGMRRGEICALRWSDLHSDCSISVSHAFGLKDGGFYLKEPKTTSSMRTIPLTRHIYDILSAMKKDATRTLAEFGIAAADPYILGTQEPNSRPYSPQLLGKEFAAFCKMNGFTCTFHDLRHTFATMMIASGTDVRTVASYLGHANVAMTLNTYADVDPDAKRAAVGNVEGAFDVDMSSIVEGDMAAPEAPSAPALVFTADQLRAMLAEAERLEAAHA